MAVKTIGNLCAIVSANTAKFHEGMQKCTADMNKFVQENSKVDRNLTQLSKKFTDFGKTLTVGVTLPIAALGFTALKAFDEEIKAVKMLESALASTGQAVQPVLADMIKFASEMQDITTVGDESTLKLLQMATSMGLNASQAKVAAKQAIGLAKAMGMSEEGTIRMTAALQQGEATLLKRYLPALKAIKDPAEQAAKANELLNNMFGAATAEALAGLGPLEQLKNQWSDLQEKFGAIIAKGLTPLINLGKKVIRWFSELSEGTKTAIVVISGLAATIGPLLLVLGTLPKVIAVVKLGFATMMGPVGLVIAGIAALVAGYFVLKNAIQSTTTVQDRIVDATKRYNNRLAEESAQVRTLYNQLKATNPKSQERKNLIDQINSTYGLTLKNLSDEKKFIEQLDNAYDGVINKLRNKILLEVQTEALVPLLKEQLDLEKKIAEQKGYIEKTESLVALTDKLNDNKDAQKSLIEETNKLLVVTKGLEGGTGDLNEETKKYTTTLEKLKAEEVEIELALKKEADTTQNYTNLQKQLATNTAKQIALEAEYKKALEGVAVAIIKMPKWRQEKFEPLKLPIGEFAIPTLDVKLNLLPPDFSEIRTPVLPPVDLKIDTKSIDAFNRSVAMANAICADLETQFADIDLKAEILGDTTDVTKDKTDAYNEVLYDTTKLFKKNSIEVGELKANYQKLGDSATENLAKIAKKISEISEKAQMIVGPLLSINQILLDGQQRVSEEFLAHQDAKIESINTALEAELARIDKLNVSDAERSDLKAAIEEKYAAKTIAVQKIIEAEKRKMARKAAAAAKAQALFGAIIATAEATAKALTAGPGVGVALAIITAALGLAEVGLIAAQPLPALAKGGIVKEETIARIGEAGPEAIVPLNQLKSEPMELTTRITAQDIELILKRRTKSLRFTNVE